MNLLFLVATLLIGCGGETTETPESEACDLSFDTLAGKTFAMLEALPDQSYRENVQARMRFESKDGELVAKYTVMSVSDVYDYECSAPKGEGDDAEMYCAEKERARDWCQALLVNEVGSCTKKALKKLGIQKLTDDELNAEIKKAKETVKKFKNTERWDQFVLNNNNLGNKLQGRLYLKIDPKKCRLSVSDMYFTIYEGKGREDTNPVGINPFVETQEDLLFKHCTEGRGIVADLNTEEPPKNLDDIPVRRPHSVDKPIYYWYLGEKGVKAEEGCTYSMDTWVNWRPVEKDIAIKPGKKGALKWTFSNSFAKDDLVTVQGHPAGVATMIRYKSCGSGDKEVITVACNASVIND